MLFLLIFVGFCLLITIKSKSSDRKMRNSTKAFWEKESRANNTRRLSLDSVPYITIPLERLPMETSSNEQIAECQRLINELSTQKIANLSSYSNTDLKLTYGAPNLDLLSTFDQNCTLLFRTLTTWSELLLEEEQTEKAKAVLEFAISCKSDISKHYTLLAEIYKKENTPRKIEPLISMAESLDSLRKPSILRALNEISQSAHNL